MTKRASSLGLAAALALASALPLSAQQFALAVDVPSNLGGTVYGANQIVQYNSGAGGYSLGTDLSSALGPAGHISALTEVSPGTYYLAVDVPTTIGGSTYQPNDILKYAVSGGLFSLVQSGSGLGLPASAKIDALAVDPASKSLVISLNVPVTVASVTYQPSDLVKVTGTALSLYWNGTAVGMPSHVNVVGAEILVNGDILLNLDAPVTLAGTVFLPGDIARYSGAAFSAAPFSHDAAFPPGAAMTDFALPGSPGTVPDGTAATTPLRVAKSATPGALDMTWGSACSSEATGYGLYEGALGTWYSHSALACLGSSTSTTVSPSAGNRYYLVAPRNGDYEGSYGKDSSANEIPSGSSACQSSWDPSTCP